MNNTKNGNERGRRIWILRTKDGKKIVDRFVSKALANKRIRYYKKRYFMEVEVVRDNSFRETKKLEEIKGDY